MADEKAKHDQQPPEDEAPPPRSRWEDLDEIDPSPVQAGDDGLKGLPINPSG
jgi:hypothetical protein